MMVGTGGLRKLRFAFKGKGKSGSARVCYVDFAAFEKDYLIQVFSKDEKPNLTDFYDKFVHIPCGWWLNVDQRNKIVELIKKGW